MKKKFFLSLLAAIGISLCVFPVMSFFARKDFENKVDVHLQGQMNLHFGPVFELRNVRLNWQDKVRILSGDLTVRYDPFTFWHSKGVHIVISSHNLRFQLEGDWAAQVGQNMPVKLDELLVDIRFNQQGISEILSVNIQSPELRFVIG